MHAVVLPVARSLPPVSALSGVPLLTALVTGMCVGSPLSLPFLRLGSATSYRFTNESDGADISSTGWSHVEKNWGSYFPHSHSWMQGTTPDNAVHVRVVLLQGCCRGGKMACCWPDPMHLPLLFALLGNGYQPDAIFQAMQYACVGLR